MKLSHYWKLVVLLVSSTQLANGQVVFTIDGTSCQGYNVTLGCIISSFNSNADLKRGDGTVVAVSCSSANRCSQRSIPTSDTKYSFLGNTSGIYMSTTLPASEHGINWTCIYNTTGYIYQFDLECSVPSEPSKNCYEHIGWGILGAFIGVCFAYLILRFCIKDKEVDIYFMTKVTIVVSILSITIAAIICYRVCGKPYVEVLVTGAIVIIVVLIVVKAVMMCYNKREDKRLIQQQLKDQKKNQRENDAEDQKRIERENQEEDQKRKEKEKQEEDQKRKEREKRKEVLPECLEKLATTIDIKCPTVYKWTNEKGEEHTVDTKLERNGHRLTSLSPKTSAALKDRGIYQCVRKLENGEKDTINVVFHVSELCPTLLTVHPTLWKEYPLKDKDPNALKKIVEQINTDHGTLNDHDSDISWKFRSTTLKEYKLLRKKSESLRISKYDDAGEYKCTVKSGIESQVYFFVVQFIDGHEPQTDKCTVIGVPSIYTE